jgi:photosystem II stability/assembly factor-like uncharacterized protein
MRVSSPRHRDLQLKRLPALLGLLLTFCIFNSSAYAQCTSPPGNDGTKEWFADSGSEWSGNVIFTPASTPPTGCPSIGNTCSDGSKFAGDTDMYVTDVDQSSGLTWSTENIDTGADSLTDGAANQAWIVANRTLSDYPAFELCENLSRHGHTDWYLPAKDELNVLYQSGITASIHWSSTESSNTQAWYHYTGSPAQRVTIKSNSTGLVIRCIRRAGGSSPATIADSDVNGTLGPFLGSAGQSFTVSGSSSNDGSFTADVIPDNDTIEVSETLTTEGPVAVTIATGGSPATYKFCIDGNWVDLAEDGTLGSCTTEADWDYDATEKTFKQCDGTDWQKIGCAGGDSTDWTGNVIFTPAEIGGNCLPGAENTWTTVANLPQSKTFIGSAPLSDGRALFCGGGSGSNGSGTNRCDIYDPNTNVFTQVANLPQSKKEIATTQLLDGRVLFCGGQFSSGSTNRCDIYDPDANSFTQVANLPQSKQSAAASILGDGRVIICGGEISGSRNNRCDIYDPVANSFTQVANFPESKAESAATMLQDGRALFCGGIGGSFSVRCDIYNGSTNTWTQVANLPQARTLLSASTLSDGKVLTCGGRTFTSRCDIYDPVANSFTSVANMPQIKEGHGAVTLGDGRVIVCGGYKGVYSGSNLTNTCYIYNYNCGGGSPATIADFGANGTLGPFLGSAGTDFTVSGSSSNDGSFTADAIPDNDTIEVSEILTTEGPVAVTISTSSGGGGSCAHDTWTPRDSDRQWRAVGSSADGTKLVAVVYGGQIYTSTDSGATWTARDSNRNWLGVASSDDGTKLVAVVLGGQIYTSTNSGVSWTARESNRFWGAVASSDDGTKLVAVVGLSGQIYTSTDSGVSWTARESNRNWIDVASSSDGTKLVAVVYGGQIYTSTNSGVSWTARDSNRNWYGAASSSDGTKLVAAVAGGQIYTSTDNGVSWTARDSNRGWYDVASSSDGTRLAAVVSGGQIYVSEDSGVTWTAKESSQDWVSIASSDDGSKLAAVVGGTSATGKIYTSECPGGSGGGGSCTSLGSCVVEGRMEYDTANDVMMYCDGTDWFPLAEATP